tara:strand:- start:770 stop:2203 length:1434 start_codon:yes stop_codon:yes gene_type:complete
MGDNKIDINSLIGFFLIGLIFIGWLYLNPPPPQPEIIQTNENDISSNDVPEEQDLSDILSESEIEEYKESNLNFENSISQNEQLISVDTDKFIVTFSTLGGQISSLELKEHLNYLGNPINLIKSDNSSFDLDFTTKNGRKFNTKDQKFISSLIDQGDVKKVSMKLVVSEDVFIEYLYSININDYIIELDINSRGFYNILDTTQKYNLNWELSAFRNSKSISYENRYSYMTYYHDEDKIDYLSISGDDEDEEDDVNWISFKQHFFSSVLISENSRPFKNVELKSEDLVQEYSTDTLFTKKFTSKIPFDYVNSEFDNSLKFYFGPNQYSQLETYEIGLEESVDFGWGIFGFINKNIFVPLYRSLSHIFPYGIAIIFMTFIVRLMLAPLLYKSYLSQAKMKILRPELDEINKKFKDNAMKKQQEMMSLYRKAGASPMGGCLPGVLQIPVFYALFMFFPSAFDLRQKSFLWADDFQLMIVF